MTTPTLPRLLPLTPQYRERVWGGQRLHPSTSGTPIGEAWIAYGKSVVSGGPLQGRTLDELGVGGPGDFPLLIKLLDCADWLSVQVHPNDAQAEAMVGPGMRGKTEAWHLLQAAPGAELLAGVKEGVTQGQLTRAIRNGTVLEVAERWPVATGDTVFIPAGTLHALGPGLLLYEVQQSSDTTYRVYDWDRPASSGRALHLEESVAVTRTDLHGDLRPQRQTNGQGVLVRSEYFVLEGVRLAEAEAVGRQAEGFQIVTVTAGRAELTAGGETQRLDTFQTILVTAGSYSLKAVGGEATLLAAKLPD
ncbi:type I phosphomannose isomerase catalytic subunit [Deinococcus sp.]|uniref:type I phosphomannose isomerase catalytic subunit n=1 Tax=Deinococcus sp. TaxID=47478 RepID=UPI003C7A3FE0